MPGLTVPQAETIYKLTTGRERFLVTTDGGFRWSAFHEDDERDDHDQAGKPIASPAAAVGQLLKAVGFLRVPEGAELPDADKPGRRVAPAPEVVPDAVVGDVALDLKTGPADPQAAAAQTQTYADALAASGITATPAVAPEGE